MAAAQQVAIRTVNEAPTDIDYAATTSEHECEAPAENKSPKKAKKRKQPSSLEEPNSKIQKFSSLFKHNPNIPRLEA